MIKKKVALLLPGISRSAKLCYKSLKSNILDKFNVDVFIHTYNQSNISVDENESFYENSFEDLINLYNPKIIIIEDYFDIRQELVEKLSKIRNVSAVHPMRCISSFYKIEKCFNLLSEVDVNQYDFIIRSRMDILYESQLHFSEIKDGFIYIPNPSDKKTSFNDGYYKSYSGDYHSSWIMDHFAISNFDGMKKYCEAYSNLEYLCIEKNISLHPELITKQNIVHSDFNIKRFNFDYSLYRKPVK